MCERGATRVGSTYALRCAISNHRTRLSDIDILINEIGRLYPKIAWKLRINKDQHQESCNLEPTVQISGLLRLLAFKDHLRVLEAPRSGAGAVLLSTNGIGATGFQPVCFSVMYYNLPSHF